MKILIAGSGAREHALCWRLAQRPGAELYAIPGNPGIARLAECLPTADLTPQAILAAARALSIDLTVIGPEAALVAGVVDLFRAARMPIVGPDAAAARLEGSKLFAKQFFADHRIPTARFERATTPGEAVDALRHFTYPVVLKADGLAAGKGVRIATTEAQAREAIEALGPLLVIEEFLEGPEVSFIALCDGRTVVPLLPARDHKRVFDGDQGPNTGGMGAYCDAALLTDSEAGFIVDRMLLPTVAATGFTGFLYAGLILTADGPKLLEYNVRLGDPETQALMHHLDDDWAGILQSAAQGALRPEPLRWKPGISHAVVLAAEGYPGPYRSADAISGIADAEAQGAVVFHAGTRVGWSGYATAGGRVLTVTCRGDSLAEAAGATYSAVERVHFNGMHYRRDIGRHLEDDMMKSAKGT